MYKKYVNKKTLFKKRVLNILAFLELD